MILAVLAGVALRLALAWSGLGRWLAWRVEISTASNSALELREGVALHALGVSPYAGSSCRVPPLALWLYGSTAQDDRLYVLPNVVLDVAAAVLLHRVAVRLLGPRGNGSDGGAGGQGSTLPAALPWLLLLSPLLAAPSAAGTTAPLEGLALAAMLYGATGPVRQGCRAAVAAAGLAAATYMSLHWVALLMPVSCLLAYGPEDVATPLEALSPGGRAQAQRGATQTQAAAAKGPGEAGKAGKEEDLPAPTATQAQAKEADAIAAAGPEGPEGRAAAPSGANDFGSGGAAPAPPPRPLLPWRTLASTTALTAAWLLLLVLASDVFVQHLPGAACITSQAARPPTDPWVDGSCAAAGGAGSGGTCSAASAYGSGGPVAWALSAWRVAAGRVARRLAATRGSLAGCWARRVYGSQLLLDDVTPNIGQWWYLAMEVFEDSKFYIRLLAHSLLAALAPPLAMRLGHRRPLALLVCQLAAVVLLKPYPSLYDIGLLLSAGLPFLARQQGVLMWHGAYGGTALLLCGAAVLLGVLGPAMLHMWLSYESANSNFYYSVGLLYGVWQVVLGGQLLAATLRVDRLARGKERLERAGS